MNHFNSPVRKLEICDCQLWVHLGCSAEERAHSQEVRVSLEIDLPLVPNGEASDKLTDTLCYAMICHALQESIRNKEFCLVEKLAKDLYDDLEKLLPSGSQGHLIVHKTRPPMDSLLGGVKYHLWRHTP